MHYYNMGFEGAILFGVKVHFYPSFGWIKLLLHPYFCKLSDSFQMPLCLFAFSVIIRGIPAMPYSL